MIFGPKKPPIVISVGGSLIVPNGGVDEKFVANFNYFIRNYIKKGFRFFLVAGGGRIARHYRDAAKNTIGSLTDEDLDWLAIHATRLNAHLLRTIFYDVAHPRIIENYEKKLNRWKEPVVIGAGWKPGWSTDYDAVLLARDYSAKTIINLSNIYYVYDKDPNKYKDAKPIEKTTWEEMEAMMARLLKGGKWIPGLSAPFDPIATKLAKKLQLTVIITNGKDFKNLQNILDGKSFKGTVITPFKIDASFYNRQYYLKNSGLKLIPRQSILGRLIAKMITWYRAIIIKLYLNPKNALDVGCGAGNLVSALRKLGVDAYGLEISKEAIEIAHPSVKPYIYHGDITKISFKNNSFDLVLTFDVLDRIERDKLKKAISETIRVSRKFILHKIYTLENIWISLFHKPDFSYISVFDRLFWQKKLNEFPQIKMLRKSFLRLPSFFETIFLLEKK
jgi:uridylate kinase